MTFTWISSVSLRQKRPISVERPRKSQVYTKLCPLVVGNLLKMNYPKDHSLFGLGLPTVERLNLDDLRQKVKKFLLELFKTCAGLSASFLGGSGRGRLWTDASLGAHLMGTDSGTHLFLLDDIELGGPKFRIVCKDLKVFSDLYGGDLRISNRNQPKPTKKSP